MNDFAIFVVSRLSLEIICNSQLYVLRQLLTMLIVNYNVKYIWLKKKLKIDRVIVEYFY